MFRSFLRYSPLLYALLCSAFDFTATDPVSCDEFSVEWNGGTAPFYLTLIPVFGVPRNISIPQNAFQDGKGTFKIDELPFAPDQRFLVSMSDATGFEAGGASPLFTPESSDKRCNTDSPSVDFSFQLNDQLQQCGKYTISGFDGAAQPVEIMAIVPDGEVTVLRPDNGATSFDWTVDIKEGTNVIFMMTDARARQGGSSRLLTVEGSDNQSCLNGNNNDSVPTSTHAASGPSATHSAGHSATSASVPTASSESVDSNSSSKPVGAIVGGVLAALVGIAAVGAILLFYWRRKQAAKNQWSTTPLSDSPFPSIFPGYQKPPPNNNNHTATPDPFHDENAVNSYPNTAHQSPGISYYPPQPTQPQPPYTSPAPPISPFNGPSEQRQQQPQPAPSSIPTFSVTPAPPSTLSHEDTSTSSSVAASQRKALEAANNSQGQPPSRFILHTDAEDTNSSVVELPPQYSDRRFSHVSVAESRSSLAYAQDTFVEEYPSRQ